MFCPRCGAEYREGFYTCSDCNIPLVNQLFPEPETKYVGPGELVTVLETKDAHLIRIAASWLESADIFYLVNGKSLQELYMETGQTAFDGTFFLQVEKSEANNVKDLLSDIEINQVVDNITIESSVVNTAIIPKNKKYLVNEQQDDESLSSAKAFFRTMVVADVVFIFLILKLGTSVGESLPISVKEYLVTLYYSKALWKIAYDLYYPSLVLDIVAAIGLMAFWRFARLLYLLAWLWALFTTICLPAYISYGILQLCYTLACMLGGAIIAAMYLPPINKAFRQ